MNIDQPLKEHETVSIHKLRLSPKDWAAISGVMITQLMAALVWGVGMDRRVTELKVISNNTVNVLEKLDIKLDTLTRVDERLHDVKERQTRIESRIDMIENRTRRPSQLDAFDDK